MYKPCTQTKVDIKRAADAKERERERNVFKANTPFLLQTLHLGSAYGIRILSPLHSLLNWKNKTNVRAHRHISLRNRPAGSNSHCCRVFGFALWPAKISGAVLRHQSGCYKSGGSSRWRRARKEKSQGSITHMTAAGPEVENGTRFLSLSLCLLLCRRRRVCRVRRADEREKRR
jgi:hypothetical protein